jgi:hypothetical protein
MHTVFIFHALYMCVISSALPITIYVKKCYMKIASWSVTLVTSKYSLATLAYHGTQIVSSSHYSSYTNFFCMYILLRSFPVRLFPAQGAKVYLQ